MKEAVILVPGIMGSVLKDGADEVWPGSVLEIVLPYSKMAQLMQPDLKATDVIRRVSIVSQYDNLIEALKTCGFDEDAQPRTMQVFPYDWRKSNADAAAALADCIDDMANKLGADCEINLLAHSMGGLVSRCYLESGAYLTRPGYARVKRLITMGTPHRGAPMALMAALGQEKRVFLSAKQVQQVASDPAFPSLYQLLPPQFEPFLWNRSAQARFEPVDLYDTVATPLGLVEKNLASATDFHSKLDLARKPAHVRYFCFAGSRQRTTSSVQITLSGFHPRVEKIEVDDAGDGTVPTWSASLPRTQIEPVGGEHGDLYKNGRLKSVLGGLLGKLGVLLAAGPEPELSVLPKVAAPEENVRVTIDFPRGTQEAQGTLVMRRRIDANGKEVPAAPAVKSDKVVYKGPLIDHLVLLLAAPDYAGIYSLEFTLDGRAGNMAQTELFVQSAS